MWMVGYNEGGEFNMADYAFNGRKLRPLMPRPLTSSPNNNNNNTSTPTSNVPCLTRNDFFSQYHNLGDFLLLLLLLSSVCISFSFFLIIMFMVIVCLRNNKFSCLILYI